MRKSLLVFLGLILGPLFLFPVGKRIYKRVIKTPPVATEKELAELIPISPPPLATPLATPSASPIALKPTASSALLPPTPQVYQTFNNCGPATLAMILGFYGIKKTQQEIGEEIRPYQHPKGKNDDKTVFPQEFANFIQKFGLSSMVRPAGDIELVKKLVSNGFPVIVKQWLHQGEDIGHFRIIRGFDENKRILISDDSYDGPNRKISYDNFLRLWQPFNYTYILVYPPSQQERIEALVGEHREKTKALESAVKIALGEIRENPKVVYPYFNLSTSFYYLGDFQKSTAYFEKVEKRLPKRMLWYQIEPILAYQKLEKYQRVFELTERIFASGNPAFSELYLIRGEVYLAQGMKEKAQAEFKKAIFYNKNFKPAQQALEKLKT